MLLLRLFLVWAGVGLTDLGSEAMEISKSFAGIVAAHYPERLYRLELLPAVHLQLLEILHATECASRAFSDCHVPSCTFSRPSPAEPPSDTHRALNMASLSGSMLLVVPGP